MAEEDKGDSERLMETKENKREMRQREEMKEEGMMERRRGKDRDNGEGRGVMIAEE